MNKSIVSLDPGLSFVVAAFLGAYCLVLQIGYAEKIYAASVQRSVDARIERQRIANHHRDVERFNAGFRSVQVPDAS